MIALASDEMTRCSAALLSIHCIDHGYWTKIIGSEWFVNYTPARWTAGTSECTPGRGKSCEPNHHDFKFDSLIFQGVGWINSIETHACKIGDHSWLRCSDLFGYGDFTFYILYLMVFIFSPGSPCFHHFLARLLYEFHNFSNNGLSSSKRNQHVSKGGWLAVCIHK